ncbi:MAG TPA: DUF1566 domain-containing protein [Labilithrix sp.]|jgi:hypothetical protein
MAPSRRRILFAMLAGASTTLLVACAGIIGLDDFHKGECPGARCEGGANVDVNQPDAPFGIEAGPDGGDAGPGAGPVSWAHWRMPNYEAGTADVENAPLDQPGTGFVKDTITGLTWLVPMTAPPSGSYAAADAFCKSQTAANGGWRLPTRIELVSLLDFGSATGTLVGPAFTSSTPSGAHWTASPERTDKYGAVATEGSRNYWTVAFDTGIVKLKLETTLNAVKCVKGGS